MAEPPRIVQPAGVEVCADSLEVSKCQVYVKAVAVKAKQMKFDFYIHGAEGIEHGLAGDWIVQGPTGSRWICSGEMFKKVYQPVASPDEAPKPESEKGNA